MQHKSFILALAFMFLLPLSSWGHGTGGHESDNQKTEDKETDEPAMNFPQEGQEAPNFTLIDQNNKNISLTDYRGRPVFVTFIYTNCPDACPLILKSKEEMAESFENGMGETGLVIMAITVDPGVDTPDVLKAYAKRLELDEEDLHLLTGSPETVKKAILDYGIATEKDEISGLVGHAVIGYTITGEGKIDKSILFSFPGS